MPVYEV